MAVPDFQSLMLPVLRAAVSGELSMVETREKVANSLRLMPEDLAERLPSGRQTTFANRIAWAKNYLEVAGLVETLRRGVFQITERGREVLAEQPERIDMNFLRRFPEYVAWRHGSPERVIAEGPTTSGGSPLQATITPEEQIEAAHATLLAALQVELLERMIGVPWQLFEVLVVDLLTAMGYGGGRAEMARAFTKAGDEGLDGVVKEDALGLDVVYVQAKCWAREHVVGRPEIQAFVGSLEGARASKGVFVTTSSFSQPALDFVGRVSKRIVLIDGKELARLLVEHGVAVRVASRYEIKKVDEGYFSE